MSIFIGSFFHPEATLLDDELFLRLINCEYWELSVPGVGFINFMDYDTVLRYVSLQYPGMEFNTPFSQDDIF